MVHFGELLCCHRKVKPNAQSSHGLCKGPVPSPAGDRNRLARGVAPYRIPGGRLGTLLPCTCPRCFRERCPVSPLCREATCKQLAGGRVRRPGDWVPWLAAQGHSGEPEAWAGAWSREWEGRVKFQVGEVGGSTRQGSRTHSRGWRTEGLGLRWEEEGEQSGTRAGERSIGVWASYLGWGKSHV